jgi:hypothetical protein
VRDVPDDIIAAEENYVSVDHENKDLVNKIRRSLIAGESLYAVFDFEEDSFVAVTDLRLLFPAASETISLPYSQITAVGAEQSDSSLAGGRRLRILAGKHTWSFELNEPQKLEEAYMLIMRNVLQNEASGMSLRL